MIIKQPTLNNFAQYQNLGLMNNNVIISKDNVIHTKRIHCPDCGTLCSYNGSSNKGNHILSKNEHSFLKKGQQKCPHCNKTVQVSNEWINKIKGSLDQFFITQISSLSQSMSEEEISKHFEDTMGVKLPKSSVHRIIKKINEEIEALEFEYQCKEGFYAYDEQFVKVNGKLGYRIVILDIDKN